MEDVRQLLQQLSRHFGLLNKNCCTVGNLVVSLVQSHILYEIDRQYEPSMQQIATTLGVDITAFSHQIQTLVKKKLVIKSASSLDKRVSILSLSTEGKFVSTMIDQQVNSYLNQAFLEMTVIEKENIIGALMLLDEKMSKVSVCCG
jgi:DNA-binding MarR family transcriptional regulator